MEVKFSAPSLRKIANDSKIRAINTRRNAIRTSNEAWGGPLFNLELAARQEQSENRDGLEDCEDDEDESGVWEDNSI